MLYTQLGGTKDSYLTKCLNLRTIPRYNQRDFIPFLGRDGSPRMDKSVFNAFTGFPMEAVKLTATKRFEDSLLYSHIRDGLIGGNEDEFNHLLDHIADIFQDPRHIKSIAHVFVSKQGMGKGMLNEFMTNLLGHAHIVIFNNIDTYFNNFNSEQSNKLLKIIEEMASKGKAFDNHDRLKADIAKTKERIENKGFEAYTQSHYARYWLFSNHEDGVHIPPDCRRYTLHLADNTHANNLEYFAPIWEEVRDQQFCKVAFEFFINRKYNILNARKCFENQFKLDQKNINLPLGLKFLIEICENQFTGIACCGDRYKSTTIANTFKKWCEDNGCKFSLNALKTQLRKIELKDSSLMYNGQKSKCYTLNVPDMERRFKTLLKNPDFKFK